MAQVTQQCQDVTAEISVFSTKWQQWCRRSNITRESVPDPGTSCSKWAVTNSNAMGGHYAVGREV